MSRRRAGCGAAMLRPLQILTRSAQQIEAGDRPREGRYRLSVRVGYGSRGISQRRRRDVAFEVRRLGQDAELGAAEIVTLAGIAAEEFTQRFFAEVVGA